MFDWILSYFLFLVNESNFLDFAFMDEKDIFW
jgi:hypothetical protein